MSSGNTCAALMPHSVRFRPGRLEKAYCRGNTRMLLAHSSRVHARDGEGTVTLNQYEFELNNHSSACCRRQTRNETLLFVKADPEGEVHLEDVPFVDNAGPLSIPRLVNEPKGDVGIRLGCRKPDDARRVLLRGVWVRLDLVGGGLGPDQVRIKNVELVATDDLGGRILLIVMGPVVLRPVKTLVYLVEVLGLGDMAGTVVLNLYFSPEFAQQVVTA